MCGWSHEAKRAGSCSPGLLDLPTGCRETCHPSQRLPDFLRLMWFRNLTRYCCLLLFAGQLLLSSLALADTRIVEVRLWRAPDSTRIVFDLDGPVEHRLFTLQNPERVVIDIPAAAMAANLAKIDLKNSPVTAIRAGVQEGNTVRVVMDLSAAVNPKSFFLKKMDGIGDRLVVDLKDIGERKVEVVKSAEEATKTRRDLIIAVDAGHGGEDPGALGPKGLQEKQVVFAIATELARLLKQEEGYRVVMVREGDYYVGLRDRREIARKASADLFVSVHADAARNKKARGGSVFALSSRGASSAEAQYLADSENRADLVGGLSLDDKDPILSSVFLDLSMTHKMDSSLEAGASILHRMMALSKPHSPRVEQAGFAVLKAPDVTSILVETGFISNPDEAKKLASPAHQKEVAKAIFQGIDDYFRRRAPEDTFIAQKYRGKTAENSVKP